MKKFCLLIISLLLFAGNAYNQTLQQFFDLVNKKDTIGQQRLLEKWEQSKPNDPDLYVAYFNFYYLKSMREIITLGQNPRGKDVFQILDTLSKEPVGYMYNGIYFEPSIIIKGFEYINKGIEKFPERLDMRFGKVFAFGEMSDYENFTQEIINTIDYSNVIKNKWLWKDHKPLKDPQNYMLGTIQSYQNQLYNTGNDSLLNYMGMISRAILKYYPDHIESLSNLSVVYLIQSKYDDALELLLKAEKVNPKDLIVLGNIAHTYKRKGDDSNAIKYYELILKYGDNQAKEDAKGTDSTIKKQINYA